jgi:hypothetical protein
MPAESHERREQELVCWHPGPCAERAGDLTLYDFLRERDEAAGEISGDSWNEVIDALVARERGWLREWIGRCPHTAEIHRVLKNYEEGSEHLVYLPSDSADVIKVTRPGLYGDSYYLGVDRVHQRACTPLDYLIRMALLAEYFNFSAEYLGVTPDLQIVTSQPFVEGDPPTDAEVAESLLSKDVEPVKLSCWLWKKTDYDSGLEY